MTVIVVKTFSSFSNCYVVGNLTEKELGALRRKEGWDKRSLKILLALLAEKWLTEYDQEFTMHAVALLEYLTRFGFEIVASVGTVSTAGTQFCWVMTRPRASTEEMHHISSPSPSAPPEEGIISRVLVCRQGEIKLPRKNDILIGFFDTSMAKMQQRKRISFLRKWERRNIKAEKEGEGLTIKIKCRRLPNGELECLIHNVRGPLMISATVENPKYTTKQDESDIETSRPLKCMFHYAGSCFHWRKFIGKLFFCVRKSPNWAPETRFGNALSKDYYKKGYISFQERIMKDITHYSHPTVDRIDDPMLPQHAARVEKIKKKIVSKIEANRACKELMWNRKYESRIREQEESLAQVKEQKMLKDGEKSKKDKKKKRKNKKKKIGKLPTKPGYRRKKIQVTEHFNRVMPRISDKIRLFVPKAHREEKIMLPPDICVGRRKERPKSEVTMDDRIRLLEKERKQLKFSIMKPKLRYRTAGEPGYWNKMPPECRKKCFEKRKKSSKKPSNNENKVKELETAVTSWLTVLESQGIESDCTSVSNSIEKLEEEVYSWLDSNREYGLSESESDSSYEASPLASSFPQGSVYMVEGTSSPSHDSKYHKENRSFSPRATETTSQFDDGSPRGYTEQDWKLSKQSWDDRNRFDPCAQGDSYLLMSESQGTSQSLPSGWTTFKDPSRMPPQQFELYTARKGRLSKPCDEQTYRKIIKNMRDSLTSRLTTASYDEVSEDSSSDDQTNYTGNWLRQQNQYMAGDGFFSKPNTLSMQGSSSYDYCENNELEGESRYQFCQSSPRHHVYYDEQVQQPFSRKTQRHSGR